MVELIKTMLHLLFQLSNVTSDSGLQVSLNPPGGGEKILHVFLQEKCILMDIILKCPSAKVSCCKAAETDESATSYLSLTGGR